MQRKKEEYQRDLERLRDAQRRLERDKDAVQRQLDKMEVRQADGRLLSKVLTPLSARDAQRLILVQGLSTRFGQVYTCCCHNTDSTCMFTAVKLVAVTLF